jgi:intein-encoded DNA endonuclease-like protein
MGKKIHLNKEEVIQKYKELKSVVKVGKVFNVSFGPIKRILKENGYNPTQRKYKVNHNYFDNIDTEEKAYWLGFIYADGYVRVRTRYGENPGQGNSFCMNLSILDIEHLKLLRKCVGSTHKIINKVSVTKNKQGKSYSSNVCRLSVNSNKLVEGLVSQGVVPRKTHILTPPKIDEKLYRHFIRGYFDGDGCCANYKNKSTGYKRFIYSIACAAPKLKEWMMEILKENDIKCVVTDNLSFNVGSFKSKYKFYHYLYDNTTIYLQRKKDKGDEIIHYFNKRKDEGIYCFQDDYKEIDNVWTKEQIQVIYDHINIVPLSYLGGTLLPTKSPQQILRYTNKHGISNDKKLTHKEWNRFVDNNPELELQKRYLNQKG